MSDEEIKEFQEEYFLQKFLMFIIFDNTKEAYKGADWLYDIHVLKQFKGVVEVLAKCGCVRPQIKNNIYNILIDGRKIEDENYKQRIELINETIIILNTMKEQEYLRFYCGQLNYRIKEEKELKKLSIKDIKCNIPLIEESICNDFVVLLSHSKDVTDEDFVNDYLPEFINNGFYYESLNMILKECPYYFQDKLFMDRMNSVIEMNKNLYPYFNKKSKSIVKRIRKYN